MRQPIHRSPTKMILLPVILLSLLAGCEKDPSNELITGDLIGFVIPADQERYALENRSGVEVTLEGSTQKVTAISDPDGKFTFRDIRSGTYDMSYSKSGFGTFRRPGFQFVGGNVPSSAGNEYIYELPDIQVSNLELTDNSQFWYVNVHATFDISNYIVADDYRIYRYYLSDSPGVSWINYMETGYTFSDKTEGIFLGLDDIGDRFPSGSDLYVIVYPCTEYNQYYVDLETGLFVYSSVNPDMCSEVAHITVPEAPEESPYN